MRLGIGPANVFTRNQSPRGPRRRIADAPPLEAHDRRSRTRHLSNRASQPHQYSPAFRQQQGQRQDRLRSRRPGHYHQRSRSWDTQRRAKPLLGRQKCRRRNRRNERKTETPRRPARNRKQPSRHKSKSHNSQPPFPKSQVRHCGRSLHSVLNFPCQQSPGGDRLPAKSRASAEAQVLLECADLFTLSPRRHDKGTTYRSQEFKLAAALELPIPNVGFGKLYARELETTKPAWRSR